MKKPNKSFLLAMLPMMLFFASCIDFGNTPEPGPGPAPDEVDGWAPVYAEDGVANTIKSLEPREIDNGGKIYVKDNRLYQVEVGKGIHVIDITDGNNPTKLRFIQVTGAQEMSIMNNNLYTNNVNDLVVVDITDINNAQLVDRVSGVFHLVDPALPPSVGYFECVDASKGTVVGWEQKKLYKPICRRN